MRPDVIDLQAFYGSRQGQLARRLLLRQIRTLWPDVAGCRVLGLGYAVPFLGPFAHEAERIGAIMPQTQGVAGWPPDGLNQVALAADDDLPLRDRSVDRVIVAHALEGAEQIRRLLREIWRVLADGGEVMFVVPNRRGLWCLSEATPFGHGQPYSTTQLKQVLRNNLFTPRRTASALFVPPVRSRLVLRTALAWERIGLRWAWRFAGVMLMTAEKQIYAAPIEPALERRPARAYVPVPRALAGAERVPEAARRKSGSARRCAG